MIPRLRAAIRTDIKCKKSVSIGDRFWIENVHGGKLLLSGVSQHAREQLDRTETFETIPESDVFMADETLGNSTRQAAKTAGEWLAQLPEPQPGPSS